jgi:hypothetical protein
MPFRPYQNENAIVNVTFACEVTPLLDTEALKRVSDLHPRFKEDLNKGWSRDWEA